MVAKVAINRVISNIHRHQTPIMLTTKIGNTAKVDRKLTDLTISGDLIITIERPCVIVESVIPKINYDVC